MALFQPNPAQVLDPQRPDTRALTVITTCMGRLHHLRQSLPLVAAQPGLRCVVVDYGCPDNAGDWVSANFPDVSVVRATAVSRFNVSKARNMGARHSTTRWICFLDADILVAPDFHHTLVAVLRGKSFFLAAPCPHELVGLVACRLEDFTAVGGYDELFEGWGSEDKDLYMRLTRSGCQRSSFAAESIRFIAHDDRDRTRFHDIADRFLSLRINGMYLQIKTDLARQTGAIELDLADRRDLYSRIRELVLSNPDASARMDVTLPPTSDFTQPPGWRLKRTVSYCFEPLAPSHHE